MSSKMPSTSATASLRERSSRSIASLVKSTLFIRTFPCESEALTTVTTAPIHDFLRKFRVFSRGQIARLTPRDGASLDRTTSKMLAGRTFASGPLRGTTTVPGDKSISHRAAIVAACSGGVVEIVGVNPGRDVRATLAALEALGVRIERSGDDIAVHSKPLHTTAATLDCMNSGSTARMLLGACAGAGIAARFDGDASLRSRPMEPVAAQLRAFGARIETMHGRLPATLFGTAPAGTRHFILIEPSAQVKSALLFAAAFAGVGVTIAGDRGSRDHTERLLRFFGATVRWDERRITFSPAPFKPQAVAIPGDFSAAAFFITAAAIAPGSAIVVRDVGVNP